MKDRETVGEGGKEKEGKEKKRREMKGRRRRRKRRSTSCCGHFLLPLSPPPATIAAAACCCRHLLLLLSTASSKAIIKELERIDHLFQSYVDKSSGMIDPEGIEQLCSDVQVDHTDVRILMLAWKMKAERQGYFTLEEWRRGLKALRADTIGKLKKALSELEKEVSKPPNFLDFYSYAFRYCLTEEKQKSIDIESICELLVIVLGSQYMPQVNSFVAYLKTQNDYKVINMDQWMGFLRFCQESNFPSLDNYDPDEAWPLILDNYVEWMREKRR